MSRTVLVTGGTGGIGRVVAAEFASAGDTVIITGRHRNTVVAIADKLGVRGIVCDVTRAHDIDSLIEQVSDHVDVLINLAGGNTDFTRASGGGDASLSSVAEAWRANLEANLLSTVLVTTASLPVMATGGTILTVGSIGAEYAATSYGTAKAAVQAWTAGMCAVVGPRGITINAISPGYIGQTDFFRGRLTDQRRDTLIAATHDKRAGLPSDIAAIALFLASPGARHITGQTIHVNGGAHATR